MRQRSAIFEKEYLTVQTNWKYEDLSFTLCVQTSSEPFIQWVLRVLSQGVKRGRGVTLTTHHI
jgi:hypothetical protein